MIRISNGLDLPISGVPQQTFEDGPVLRTVGIVGSDYIGMRPNLEVQEGDSVSLGQTLFTDRKNPGVRFTAPGSGQVIAINRGPKRIFQSLVIELDGDAETAFQSYYDSDLTSLNCDQVVENLVNSGLWTAFRTRPFGFIPAIDSAPHSIFVTAIDTNPLAVQPEIVIQENKREFEYGLQVVRHLTDGRVFVCKSPGAAVPGGDLPFVTTEEFAGPHPAGLPGTHIHFLDPVSEQKTVWYLNYQDVIAIGRLFVTGRLSVERVISLAGPAVRRPRLLRTRLGASLPELIEGELEAGGDCRVISGSVLCGRAVEGPFTHLGRYHLQVSALREGGERIFLGWQRPGFNKFSVKRVFASGLLGMNVRFPFTTSREGSLRAMVPIGSYEHVMPLDIQATFLLRSLIIGDIEQARLLGALELEEEDLALCTYVCPGKYDYAPLLRRTLNTVAREG